VCWGATVEHTKVSSYAALCTRSNVHDTFERRVQRIFFKNYKTIYTKKNIHKRKAKYLQNTSTPPPNSKCHIVHNVTENTNLGDRSI
jgi:hypothetical protein